MFREFDREPEIPVALDYTKCQGTEDSLIECVHFSHSYGCGHDNDIGVRCQPGTYYIIMYTSYI